MFREDFEFHDAAGALASGRARRSARDADAARRERRRSAEDAIAWGAEAERELGKIPFFVRGKARRNTERFAGRAGLAHDHSRDALRCQSAFRRAPAAPAAATRPGRASAHRVVIVTLDSHLAGAAARAGRTLCARIPGLDYASTPPPTGTDDAAALERCKARHRQGATSSSPPCCSWKSTSSAVLPALQARRDHCDAMIVLHVGRRGHPADADRRLHDGEPARGADGAAQAAARGAQASTGKPGRAADADAAPAAADPALHSRARRRTCAPISSRCSTGWRARTRTSPTWCACWSTATPRASARGLRGALKPAACRRSNIPKSASTTRACSGASGRASRGCLPRHEARSGTVGLLVMRSYVLAGDTAHYDGVIEAWRRAG